MCQICMQFSLGTLLFLMSSFHIGAVLVDLRTRWNVVCRWLRGRGLQQRSGRSMSVYKEKEMRGDYSRGPTQRCTFVLLISCSLSITMPTIAMSCSSMSRMRPWQNASLRVGFYWDKAENFSSVWDKSRCSSAAAAVRNTQRIVGISF